MSIISPTKPADKVANNEKKFEQDLDQIISDDEIEDI